MAVKLKQMLDDFKPHLPIISALRNPGMRERSIPNPRPYTLNPEP